MSATQNAVELCTLLVEDTYGQLYSRIFSTLLLRGRLQVGDIIRQTRLTPRQVLSGLSVLIQQRLVFYHSTGRPSSTFYEADWKSAYSLTRSGKIVQYTQERFSEEAADLVSSLLQLGHCRVGELLKPSALESQDAENNESLPNGLRHHSHLMNGDHNKSSPEPEVRREAMKVLAENGLIIRLRPSNFRSPADNRAEAEKWVRDNKSFAGKGTRLQLEIDQAVDSTLEEWYDGRILQHTRFSKDSFETRKRRRDDSEDLRGREYVKMQNGVAEYQDEEAEVNDQVVKILTDDLVIGVNYEKYVVAFRSASLISQAESMIGKVTSNVYQALLAAVEQRIQRCRSNHDIYREREDKNPAIPLFHIRNELKMDSEDLAAAIGTVPPVKDDANKFSIPSIRNPKRPVLGANEEEIVMDSASSEENSGEEMEIVKDNDDRSTTDPLLQHLYLLSTSWPQYRFCETVSSTNWVVPFADLSLSLLQTTLINLINTRFGAQSARIVRVLLNSFPNTPVLKLHENQITALSLLPARTVRGAVARLHAASFLSLQEIPKDNQRVPQRTTYLWFFDVERVRTVVLTECYKTMARLVQRIKVEREGLRELLEKLERSDVRESGERLLSPEERENLKKWRVVEDRIWGQVGRLDDMVMVLRDF